MSKGFLLALAAMGCLFYFMYKSDPASSVYKGGVFAGQGLVAVTPDTFQSTVMENPGPVIVYFWASW
jgi:thioredoxin-like negative regulator of GroEL